MFSLKFEGINDFTKSYGTAVGKDVHGLFHNELFQRTTDYLPSMSYFNDFKANKIIFACHGLVGSLAEMHIARVVSSTDSTMERVYPTGCEVSFLFLPQA